ncbi:hypothetical protein [Nitrospirillum amazonense]|uniref:hypothetical protein n=1 Tax=Nitrospirillum amazonense TaxID=28077 RepID=UPI0024122E58|nr:hypothetical protein [Nitrospirillum amazonense]MDG3442463.1 hypothetical protein [Nitrospirillum amazonense]
MFIPLSKAFEAKRQLIGRIDETPDRDGEVFDYASSKPLFEAWSGALAKASDGKNLGNVRAMHGRVAAGLLSAIHFDDAAKAIEFVCDVVDDAEWAKAQRGVYTGFSPGGGYVRKWQDGAHKRYTANPTEISLVDLPCIPSATFTFVKMAGEEVAMPFESGELAKMQGRVTTLEGDLAKAAGDLAKVRGELTGTQDALAKMTGERDTLAKRVQELEARPAPGPHLRTMEKSVDAGGAATTTVADVESGTFDERLAKVTAMPPGPEKSAALMKIAAFAAANRA